MFGKPSLVTRIAVGKLIGMLFGFLALMLMPYFFPDVSWRLRWGFFFWYTTMGAIIGVFGVMNWHPILKLPLPWWFRAPFLGAWLNFVLALIAYDLLAQMMLDLFGDMGILKSPYWFAGEGALVGLVIGYGATKLGGEGPSTMTTGA